jgi:DNA-directed RNA polymerase sigma subunit (sigma70/sigma32)
MFAYDIDCESLDESNRIAQKLLEMKSEIGLLEMSRSARYGLHLVLRRQKGKTILENQVRVSILTQTEMDNGAHDLSRVMFTTTADEDELLYLDDAIFNETMTTEESEQEYKVLKEREITIIRECFGIGCHEKGLEEIGDQLGLTRERVRQIREKSIAKLRDSGNAKILMKYLG